MLRKRRINVDRLDLRGIVLVNVKGVFPLRGAAHFLTDALRQAKLRMVWHHHIVHLYARQTVLIRGNGFRIGAGRLRISIKKFKGLVLPNIEPRGEIAAAAVVGNGRRSRRRRRGRGRRWRGGRRGRRYGAGLWGIFCPERTALRRGDAVRLFSGRLQEPKKHSRQNGKEQHGQQEPFPPAVPFLLSPIPQHGPSPFFSADPIIKYRFDFRKKIWTKPPNFT